MARLNSLPFALNIRGFTAGATGGALLLAVFAGVLGTRTSAVQDEIQSLLASRLIVIEKPGFPAQPSAEHDVQTIPATPPGESPATGIKPEDRAEKDEGAEAAAAPASAPESSPPASVIMPAKVPLPGLTEKSPQGLIPATRAADGMTAFKAYARPYTKNPALPRIAIVISGYGLRAEYSDKALELADDVTLLLSPYAKAASAWQKKALHGQHELWLELPMEAGTYASTDPGPRALSSTLLLKDNETRMHGILAQATGYAGVAGFLTDRFKDNPLMIQSLAGQVFKRGLGYLELNPAAPDLISAQAARANGPHAQATINMTDPLFAHSPGAAFELAESRAKERKPVILIAPPYPAVLEAIREWENTLPSKGIALAPLSAMAKAGE